MLKDIARLQVTGGNFEPFTNLDIFDDNKDSNLINGALIYGRNGTGKSTIARACRKIKGEDIPDITHAIFQNYDGNEIRFPQEELNHIFVFDEDYVNKKVKLHEDHLDTIIMLGEAGELTGQIDKAASFLEQQEKNLQHSQNIYNEFDDIKSIQSPKYYLNCIKEALKGDDNWAGRDKEIRGRRQNTNVYDGTYTSFIKRNPSKSKSDLIYDYKITMKKLEESKNGVSRINLAVPKISIQYNTYDR